DVLGRLEPLVDRHRQATLQHDRLVGQADLLQQLEVLAVAGADADAVGDLGDVLHVRDVDHLHDDRQPGDAAAFGQDLQAPRPQTLERVWRRPRLVDIATQDRRAGRL